MAKNVNEDPATRGGKKIEGTVQEDEHFIVIENGIDEDALKIVE